MGGRSAVFDAYTTSDVLRGSGLSSSAAFEVCIGAILRGEYNGNDMEKFSQVRIAQIGQYAENVFFGKPCGLMDQTACAVGGVITIDFKDPAHPIVGQAKLDLAKHGYVLCISDTKGSHADLTDDYAAIRREMESVAACFGQKVLRDVPEADFYAAIPDVRKKVGDRAVVRAIHFYNDCRRAAELCQAVQNDEFDKFLRLIIEGGHSSFEFNQNAYSIKNPKEQGVSLALALSQNILNGPRRMAPAGRRLCRHHPGVCAGGSRGCLPRRHRRLLWRGQLPCAQHPQLWRGAGHAGNCKPLPAKINSPCRAGRLAAPGRVFFAGCPGCKQKSPGKARAGKQRGRAEEQLLRLSPAHSG